MRHVTCLIDFILQIPSSPRGFARNCFFSGRHDAVAWFTTLNKVDRYQSKLVAAGAYDLKRPLSNLPGLGFLDCRVVVIMPQ